MNQKHVLWPAIIIVLLVAAGAVYYAMVLSDAKPSGQPSKTTTAPASSVDTSELDREAATMEESIADIESDLNDYGNVDPAQDNTGI